MTTIQKHPMELDVGDRVVNPHTGQEVTVTAPPVRCDDRASVDYRIAYEVTGRMAVNIHRKVEVHTTPEQDCSTALRVLADLIDAHPDLPALSWSMPVVRPGCLIGTPCRDIAETVTAWAAGLGAAMTVRKTALGGRAYEASATFRGARVSVSGVVL